MDEPVGRIKGEGWASQSHYICSPIPIRLMDEAMEGVAALNDYATNQSLVEGLAREWKGSAYAV